MILSCTMFGFMRALSRSACRRNDAVKASCSYYSLQSVQTILFFFRDVLELFLWKPALLALSFVTDCLRQCFQEIPDCSQEGIELVHEPLLIYRQDWVISTYYPGHGWVRLLQSPPAPSNALVSMGRWQNFVEGAGQIWGTSYSTWCR